MSSAADRRAPRNLETGHWSWIPNIVLEACEFEIIDYYAVAVYLGLARYANPRGQCWPSISRVARQLGMSRGTVRDRLGLLEENGLIAIQKHRLGPGRLSYSYLLLEPDSELRTSLDRLRDESDDGDDGAELS